MFVWNCFYLIPKTSPVFTARLSSPFIHGPLEKGAAKKWSIPRASLASMSNLEASIPGRKLLRRRHNKAHKIWS